MIAKLKLSRIRIGESIWMRTFGHVEDLLKDTSINGSLGWGHDNGSEKRITKSSCPYSTSVKMSAAVCSIATQGICHTVLFPSPGSYQSLTLFELLQSLLRNLTLPLFCQTYQRRKLVMLQALPGWSSSWSCGMPSIPGTWLRPCILLCIRARSLAILASSQVTAVFKSNSNIPLFFNVGDLSAIPDHSVIITLFSTSPPWPFSDWPQFLAPEQSPNLWSACSIVLVLLKMHFDNSLC